MVTKSTQITLVFVVLGVALWYVAATVTDSLLVQLAVLVGVGVIVPTLVNDRRTNSSA